MSTHKHVNKICVVAAVFSVLLSFFLIHLSTNISLNGVYMGYESRLFNTKKVHTIDIVIDDWDSFIATAQSEEYSTCSVVIDGEAVKNVGIRGKGNTSLSTVASMDSKRYSLKIEFDQYDSSNSYYGLDKLCLNNIIQDNTYMKDYLVYQMMREFGVNAPLCSFVYITVNGEDWGLYLAVEGIEESFLQRNYGNDYGDLYKPDSMSFGGGRGNGMDFDMSEFKEQMSGLDDSSQEMQRPDASNKGDMFGMGSSDVKLQYTNDDVDSYGNIFDNAKTNVTQADQERLIDSLKQLSTYENIEEVVDVEQVLRYFVIHNFVVNDDSYTGSMIHNYYLYEDDGKMSMIPWDYNLAFGTFQGNDASSAINDDIDEVLSDRPMQAWIFSNESYSQMYYDLYEEMLETIDAQAIIDEAYTLIDSYVEKDPTAFCSYEEFKTGVETLKEFCSLRVESVKLQLNESTDIVEVTDMNLSDMGTMSNGMSQPGNMGRPGDKGQQGDMESVEGSEILDGMTMPEGMEFPEGMEMPDGMTFPGNGNMEQNGSMIGEMGNVSSGIQANSAEYVMLGISILFLLIGIIFVSKFKRIK